MEIFIRKVQSSLAFLLLGSLLPFCSPSNCLDICQTPRLDGLVEQNQCHVDREHDSRVNVYPKRGVFEVNGTELEQSFLILNSQEDAFAVVLIYASWCPFSRALLPLFESLSSSFPSIYHFAMEESALLQSGSSYSGVNSFPVVFLHNKTVKVRYQGKRTFDCMAAFYEKYSGLKPVKLSDLRAPSRERALYPASIGGRLSDDVYLVLSLLFLIFRGLFYMLPKLFYFAKQHLADMQLSVKAIQSLMYFGKFQQQLRPHAVVKYLKGKTPSTDFRLEKGNALLSVPSWPSSSLGAVSFSEGSGTKHGVKRDV